jgi:phage terminase large subunit-like protein
MKHSSGWQADWAALRPDQQAAILKRNDWLDKARPEQRAPPGDWNTWLILAGRGWGKTRTGAEDVAWFGLLHPASRIAVAAPTAADARDTCIEGNSGLLSVLPSEMVQAWNRSLGELILTNGTRYKTFSADEPDRFRGPQHHRAWADELAAWKYPDAWDQLMFGLRLGNHPQAVVTTTPRPTPLVRGLIKDAKTIITRGSTFDNAANLAPSALEQLRAKYEGTRLGRQELYAELLDDIPGALWTRDSIITAGIPADLARVVVAVDPSGANGDGEGDSIGIVTAAKGLDGRFYVLEDATCDLGPAGWGRRSVERYHHHRADMIVAERNFGGAMVESVIRTADRNARVKLVTASRGKSVRAEPIAALYEQGRVTHAPGLTELESQMMSMTLTGYMGDGSPDRVDALVWALSELAIEPQSATAIFGTYGAHDD